MLYMMKPKWLRNRCIKDGVYKLHCKILKISYGYNKRKDDEAVKVIFEIHYDFEGIDILLMADKKVDDIHKAY